MEPAAGSYRERFEGLQSQLLFVGVSQIAYESVGGTRR
jgi:hypothetical protein